MGRFKESAEAKVQLPEDEAEVVEDLLRWLYTGEPEHPNIGLIGQRGSSGITLKRTIELYAFTEKTSCMNLKRDLMYIFAIQKHYLAGDSGPLFAISVDCFDRVYEVTPAGSGLRKYVVASYAHRLGLKWYPRGCEHNIFS